MPVVNGKEYPYTASGMKAAEAAKKKLGPTRPETGVVRKREAMKKALKARNARAGWESMTGMTKAQKAAEMKKAGFDQATIDEILSQE
jgi:hypothetical protein